MPDLIMTRVFGAPRELVFRAWTDNDRGNQWSAPRRFTVAVFESDLRPGGSWRLCMRAPDGDELWVGGVYREIVRPDRLVMTHAWQTPDGRPGHQTLITVTLATDGGRTEMNFRQTGFDSVAERDGHADGWSECFDRLEEQLAQEISA